MPREELPKLDLYRRIVQAKLFVDAHYAERIDAGEIADEACYSKFLYGFNAVFEDDSGNWFSLSEAKKG